MGVGPGVIRTVDGNLDVGTNSFLSKISLSSSNTNKFPISILGYTL